MKISVFGLGYVGCVTAACLARDGHDVLGIDVNEVKLELLRSGKSPIKEPGLDELINQVVCEKRLQMTGDAKKAVLESEISLICVGTPSNDNGSLKLNYVINVCREIGEALKSKQDFHVVVIRSTVLPGAVESDLIPELERSSGLKAGVDFGVTTNPEFLREGSAIKDYLHPSLIVVGESETRSGDITAQLYATLNLPVTRTNIRTAQMVKYASNAYHALKVTFANEMGNLCKKNGIDGQEMMEIFAQDDQLNISAAYLRPGFSFGGSCLPKDLRALMYHAKENDLECDVLSAIMSSNHRQTEMGIKMVEKSGHKRVGILGLSFKANTDDLRESPAIIMAETLVGRGYQVRIYDEKVELSQLIGSNKSFLEKELPHIASLMSDTIESLVSDSDVLVITNGTKSFHQIPELMRDGQMMIDLVGLAKDNSEIKEQYHGIGW